MTDVYDNDDVIITPSELSFGGRLAKYHVTDKGEILNGDAWLRRVCWAGEWL